MYPKTTSYDLIRDGSSKGLPFFLWTDHARRHLSGAVYDVLSLQRSIVLLIKRESLSLYIAGTLTFESIPSSIDLHVITSRDYPYTSEKDLLSERNQAFAASALPSISSLLLGSHAGFRSSSPRPLHSGSCMI